MLSGSASAAVIAVAGDHDPEQVRAAAKEILGRHQFQEPAANRIGDAIAWVFDHLFPDSLRSSAGGGPGFIGDVLLLLLLAGVVYLVVKVVRGWRPRVRSEVPEADLTIDVEPHRTASEWGALAEQLEAAGRLRDALRARYGELVALLADDGSVAPIAGRTSGELRGDVARSRPGGAAAFAEASTAFERVWYGGDGATSADIQHVRSLSADVLRAPKVVDDEAALVGAPA
jgi:hypothetical protein